MSRLPVVSGDSGAWGTVLNDFLGVSLNADGTLKSAAQALQSIFGRTGAVVATNGDYMGIVAAALSGAGVATRYVGGTSSGGPPTTGTFIAGDFIVDNNGHIWVCTTAGTPGVWAQVGGTLAIDFQTGTTYTLAASDQGNLVSMNNAAANTVTIPTNATVAFPIGTTIQIRQAGAGTTTVAAAGGVTLNSRGAVFRLAGQYAYATIFKIATDTWELTGDIIA